MNSISYTENGVRTLQHVLYSQQAVDQFSACRKDCTERLCVEDCYNRAKSKEAQALNDIKVCDGALSEEAISACRNNFNSAKAVDLTGCASIVDDAARIICQDNFWMKQAVEKRDASLCENIHAETFRDVCRQSSGPG